MGLAAVLALCLVLLAEERIEALAPQLKSYAEMKIEGAFDGKARFAIGSIEGGIFSPITLNDIKISDRNSGPVFSSVDLRQSRLITGCGIYSPKIRISRCYRCYFLAVHILI